MIPRSFKILALSLGLCLTQGAVLAQEFLSKPVRIVVPQTPGGASDALARIMAQRLSENGASPWWSKTARAQVATWAWNMWPWPRPTVTPC